MYKGYSAKQLISEFPEKGWKLKCLNYLLKKLRETDGIDRKPGSGRLRSEDMHLSQRRTFQTFAVTFSYCTVC